jgi:hypothetical protein
MIVALVQFSPLFSLINVYIAFRVKWKFNEINVEKFKTFPSHFGRKMNFLKKMADAKGGAAGGRSPGSSSTCLNRRLGPLIGIRLQQVS